MFAPKAKIWHKENISDTSNISPLYVYYMTKNRFLFIKRNAPRIDTLKFLFYFLGFGMWLSLGFYFRRGGMNTLKPFLKGLIDGMKISIK